MALHMRGGRAGQAAPAATQVSGGGSDADAGDEESEEEFEARVYRALMAIARSSSERVRSALGSCVMLGTPYEGAPDVVRQTIRRFIEAAEL
jgi:hypothetical protein